MPRGACVPIVEKKKRRVPCFRYVAPRQPSPRTANVGSLSPLAQGVNITVVTQQYSEVTMELAQKDTVRILL